MNCFLYYAFSSQRESLLNGLITKEASLGDNCSRDHNYIVAQSDQIKVNREVMLTQIFRENRIRNNNKKLPKTLSDLVNNRARRSSARALKTKETESFLFAY